MIAAVEYLESLGAFDFDEQSLGKFISLLEQEEDKAAKKAATDFLLHIVQPKSDLVKAFIDSDLVRESIDLQHSVKIYISDMEYKAAQSKSDEESSWRFLGGVLLNL